ncbi:hypothetical protein KNE206_58330 [Kitasatospora sp. NE20-6]|uniref:hypothetical protein n=1 Tax=Kitasatospora sp. NE20-6 TaxID=2859066 RepID=UPI0034DBDE5E
MPSEQTTVIVVGAAAAAVRAAPVRAPAAARTVPAGVTGRRERPAPARDHDAKGVPGV